MTKCGLCGQEGHNRNNSYFHPRDLGNSSGGGGLRGVLPSEDVVLLHRNYEDAYSSRPVSTIERPEKDHVFEIQLGDAVYEHFKQYRGMVTTRDEMQRMRNLFNSVENCNITSMAINRSKQGPFRAVKNDLVRNNFSTSGRYGVDHYVFCQNGQRRANKYQGFSTSNWMKIKSEVVSSYDFLEDNLNTVIFMEDDLLRFQATLNTVFEALQLED